MIQSGIVVQTRRTFLVHSSRVAAAAVVTPTVAWAKSSHFKRRARTVAEVTHADLIQAVNTPFNVQVNDSVVTPLTLVSVTDRLTPLSQSHLPDGLNEKFAIVLSGEADERLSQDTYHFTHAIIGEFDMFITPLVAMDPASQLYEAIFNRARPGGAPMR